MECKNFETCSAPLCPMDRASLKAGIWFPDEAICNLQQFAGEGWIRNQRKISKRAAGGYFTYGMLCRNCIIRAGITGLDPDRPLIVMERDEAEWLRNHPEKKELDEAEKRRLSARFKAGVVS